MAEVNPRDFAYRNMLVNLDKLITPRELSAMKFHCKSAKIGDKNRDRIETSLDLWEKLEERGFLGVANLTFLKNLLSSCTDNRQDVMDVVCQFENWCHMSVVNRDEVGQDLSKEIEFLEENLGRDWKFFLRSLGLQESKLEMCVESHPRNVKEQIHMAFSKYMKNITKEDILKALKENCRNDLHHKIERGLP
ncbi:hypothetical protein ACOMHN_022542 [Nucella lapillus]